MRETSLPNKERSKSVLNLGTKHTSASQNHKWKNESCLPIRGVKANKISKKYNRAELPPCTGSQGEVRMPQHSKKRVTSLHRESRLSKMRLFDHSTQFMQNQKSQDFLSHKIILHFLLYKVKYILCNMQREEKKGIQFPFFNSGNSSSISCSRFPFFAYSSVSHKRILSFSICTSSANPRMKDRAIL